MTLVPYIYGTLQAHKTHPPRWIARRLTPIMVNEGDAVSFSIFVNNAQVGSEIVFWWTGGNNLGSSGNWERSWHTVMTEVLAQYGCTYRTLGSSTTPKNPGTIAGVITLGAGYQGQTMVFTNVTRRNRRNNVTNPDGSPGYREGQILFNSIGATGTPEREKNGTGVVSGGNLIRVFDSSRTPAGIPKLAFRVDGSFTRVFEGEQFSVTITTENVIPRTVIRCFATNDGRRALSPSFKNALRDAARRVGCEAVVPRFDPENPKDYFDGVIITFTDKYDDSNPIRATFDVLANGPEDGSRLCYLITELVFEGDGAEFDTVTKRGDWVNNVSYSNGDWVTYRQIAGVVSAEADAIRFVGTTPDQIGVDQRISVDGKLIAIDVELTNRTGTELVDLRYMRLVDFDQDGAFETLNEVIEQGRCRATMAGNRVLTVGSDDPRATIGLAIAVPPTLDPYAITALPVGTKRKGDDSIHVCVDIGTLAIGASTRFRIVIDGSVIAS